VNAVPSRSRQTCTVAEGEGTPASGATLWLRFSPQAHIDLVRLEDFLWHPGDPQAHQMMPFILDALQILTHQPGVGRPRGDGLRELIINRGQSGYLALYHWDRPHHTVRVLRIHHQREAGYADDEV